MPWLRAHSRGFGALALFVMALQIVLTFGHSHLSNASSVKSASAKVSIVSVKSAMAQVALAANPDALPPGDDNDALCPLCLVGNLVASAVTASPPSLVLPIAYVLLGPPQSVAESLDIDARTAFWSRGPPVS